jgi:hypothetical protein
LTTTTPGGAAARRERHQTRVWLGSIIRRAWLLPAMAGKKEQIVAG